MAGIIVISLVGGTAAITGGVYGYRAVKHKEERKREYDIAMASVYQEIEASELQAADKTTDPMAPPAATLDHDTAANELLAQDEGSSVDEGTGLVPALRRRRLKLVSGLSVSVGGEDGEGHSTDSHSNDRDLEGSHRRSRSRLNSLSSSSSDEMMAMSKLPSGNHHTTTSTTLPFYPSATRSTHHLCHPSTHPNYHPSTFHLSIYQSTSHVSFVSLSSTYPACQPYLPCISTLPFTYPLPTLSVHSAYQPYLLLSGTTFNPPPTYPLPTLSVHPVYYFQARPLTLPPTYSLPILPNYPVNRYQARPSTPPSASPLGH